MFNYDTALQGFSSKKSKKEIFDDLKRRGIYPEAQLKIGIQVEMEHVFNSTIPKKDKEIIAERIALDHLAEIPDYYTRLLHLEQQAEKYWKK